MQTLSFEQRGQQRVLVFAVAILIVQHVGGSMRLVAADSQREADIAEVLGDVVVKALSLLEIGGEALRQFGGLGLHFGAGDAAVFLQPGIPDTDLCPGFESRELNVGAIVFGVVLLLFLVLVFVLVIVFADEVRTRPVVNAAAVFFTNRGIQARLAFQLHRAANGDIHIDRFVEHDAVLVELVIGPELSRRQRRVHDGDQVVFQDFAGAQAGHGDVLLAVVRVDGGVVFNGSAQVLHGIVAGFDHSPVLLEHADVRNFDALVG